MQKMEKKEKNWLDLIKENFGVNFRINFKNFDFKLNNNIMDFEKSYEENLHDFHVFGKFLDSSVSDGDPFMQTLHNDALRRQKNSKKILENRDTYEKYVFTVKKIPSFFFDNYFLEGEPYWEDEDDPESDGGDFILEAKEQKMKSTDNLKKRYKKKGINEFFEALKKKNPSKKSICGLLDDFEKFMKKKNKKEKKK